jgi:hypothetical protein
MTRFVILEHNYPELHWDFMLERETNLRTWKLLKSPEYLLYEKNQIAYNEHRTILAEDSFDHRLIYLDYEGPISGSRGIVKRFDWGTFSWLEQRDNLVAVQLSGQKIMGKVKLVQLQKPPELSQNQALSDDGSKILWQVELSF